MSNLPSPPFILPTSQSVVTGPYSVSRTSNTGTNFSVFGIGGYVEVESLADLSFSSQTIPINYSLNLSGDVVSVTLNSDNISSGRRRLGMVAYVYETDLAYQFYIPNYQSIFDAATGTTPNQQRCVLFYNDTTIVNVGCSGYTQLLLDGWTGSSIEGVSGVTRSNASWRIFSSSGTSSGFTAVTLQQAYDNSISTPEIVTVAGLGAFRVQNGTGNPDNSENIYEAADSLGNVNSFIRADGLISATTVDTPTVELGLDLSGNTRTVDADSVVLENDVLNGGTY